jgi:hypothetical protein
MKKIGPFQQRLLEVIRERTVEVGGTYVGEIARLTESPRGHSLNAVRGLAERGLVEFDIETGRTDVPKWARTVRATGKES